MIDTEILQDYASEARELLDEMDHSLIRLEKEGGAPELLNNIFRAVHCIKGSAEYIGLERSSTLTHGVENLLDRMREGLIEVDSGIIDFLFRSKDLIQRLIDEVARDHEEKSLISQMMDELEIFLTRPAGRKSAHASQLEAETSAGPSPAETPPAPDYDEPPAQESSPAPEYAEDVYEIESAPLVEEAEPIASPNPFERMIPETEESIITEIPSEFRGTDPPYAALVPEQPEDFCEITLSDTVSKLLNISLYLDDLQDGLHPGNVISQIEGTVQGLITAMESLDLPEAANVLETLKNKLETVDQARDRLTQDEIHQLRAALYKLKPFYPDDLLPWKDITGATDEPAPALSPFFHEMAKIPGVDEATISALETAGYDSLDQLAVMTNSALNRVPGVSQAAALAIFNFLGSKPTPQRIKIKVPAKKKAPAAPRSLLEDVSDDLLREFEQIFDKAMPVEDPALSPAQPDAGAAGDLLEELGSVGEDSDREIMEIFLSYGWEILDKLRPSTEKIKDAVPDRIDLEACSEHIKAIRSSSSYMDYKKLAAFLEEWYDKTLWAAQNAQSLTRTDLVFMEAGFLKFQDYLRGLEIVLNPHAAEALAKRTAPTPAPPVPQKAKPPLAPPPAQKTAKANMGIEPGGAKQTKPADKPPVVSKPAAAPPPVIEAQPAHAPEKAHAASDPRAADPKSAPSAEEFIPSEIPTEELRYEANPIPEPSAGVQDHLDSRADLLNDPDDNRPIYMQDGGDRGDGAVVRTMRVDSAKVDILLNQVGELVVNRSYVEQLALELKSFHRVLLGSGAVGKRELQLLKELSVKVGEASLSLGRVATDLQEGVMKLRMLPVGQLFNRMPRLIRDLSRRVGKAVALQVQGGDTEVDKRVIEQIYNPLVHLIRNAVDHGIEDRETRKTVGKQEEGMITLSAYSQGNQVVIDVEDDGAGINAEAVIEKALENRLVDPQDVKSITPHEIYNLLFLPGFSTSKKVTRTSGRGVGMDVVKKDVEKINGHIEIDSMEHEGTKISIKIPLTLAIIQTLLIKSSKHVFAIPLTSVREIIQISPQEITTIEGFEVVKFRDETIPVLRVSEVFRLRGQNGTKIPRFLVLTTAGTKSVGFLVEELMGEQDVVIKPLAEHVLETRGLAGSTILGDGTIALVLDVLEVIEDVIAQQRQIAQSGFGFRPPDDQPLVAGGFDM